MSFPVSAMAAETVEDPYEAYLRLGKPKPGVDQIVGGLQVWNDAETLYVQFEADEPYCISALHLQVSNDLSDTPAVQGITLPGVPAINEEYDDCLPVRGPFEFDLIENGWEDGSYLVIAAHADISELECTVNCVTLAIAPYYADEVIDYEQGLRADGSPVLEIRSDPEAVFIYDPLEGLEGFFSMGHGGWLEVRFDNPIVNGPGDDLVLIEDTWGVYIPELALVYASTDGETWTLLGEANNYTHDPININQTISSFDLGTLDNVSYIRVEDITPIVIEEWDADGYDLNAIIALHDCVQCTETCVETELGRAWAGNKIDTGAVWSRWVRYAVVIDGETQPVGPLPAAGTEAFTDSAQNDEAGVADRSNNGGAAILQNQKGR